MLVEAPERDTPGTSASIWARPIRMPSRYVMSVSPLVRRPSRSASPSRMPKTMSTIATIQSERNDVRMVSCSR